MKILPRVLLTILFCAMATLLRAEPLPSISVQAQIFPSTTVPLASTARIEMTVMSNQKIVISSFSLPEMEEINVTKSEMPPAEKKSESQWIQKFIFNLMPLNVGDLTFPGLTVPYKTEANQPGTLITPPVKFSAVNALNEPASPEMLKDIKPPVELGSPWFWIALLIAILIVATVWIIVKHKKPAATAAFNAEPEKPADEWALERLQAILEEYRRTADDKKFYVELSNILREYLGRRYGMDALEKTTTEIFGEMRRENIDRKIALQVKEILSECDLVKFAKYRPAEKQLIEDFERAKQLIEDTRLKAAPAVEAKS